MLRPRPRDRALMLRRYGSQLIFAWGSVVSVLIYGILTVLQRPPLVDTHLTVTAVSMLATYLIFRIVLDGWTAYEERNRA